MIYTSINITYIKVLILKIFMRSNTLKTNLYNTTPLDEYEESLLHEDFKYVRHDFYNFSMG